jgi:hypothetical protein
MLRVRVKRHCLINGNERRPPPWASETRSVTQQKTSAARPRKPTGNATDNDRLKAEGQTDQVKADAKKVGESVKDEFKRD